MTPPSESQTAKLLGYPGDARLLIINADDFGMCHAANAAIFRSLTEGIVCSTTLMVPCAWSPQAIRLLKDNPDIPFGVHLTAVSDGLNYRWKPVTCRDKIPSLVDEMGYFYNWDRMSEFLAHARLDELEVEFRAQIETVLGSNLRPTHLDWHSIRINQRPDIFDVMFKLAREYRLALRVRERDLIEKVRRHNLPVNDHDFLDSYLLETAGKSDRFAQLLRDLPAGLSEWAVHPGLADAELLAIEPDGAAVRQADLDFVVSAQAREVIEQEGIILLSYQPLQELWRG